MEVLIMFGLVVPFIALAVLGVVALRSYKTFAEFGSFGALAFPPRSISARDMANELGLTLVEGDPCVDIQDMPELLGGASHNVRMVGDRHGRRVELVQRAIWDGSTTARDRRVSLQVSTRERFELFAISAEELYESIVPEPEMELGDDAFDEHCILRASSRSVVSSLTTHLQELARIPCAHISLSGGWLTLHERLGMPMLATYGPHALSIFERIADQLEAIELVTNDGPTQAMSAVPLAHTASDDLGERVRVMTPSIAHMLVRLFSAVVFAGASLLYSPVLSEGFTWLGLGIVALPAVLAMLSALDFVRSLFSKVVMRQHGFEWHRWSGKREIRYADVRRSELSYRRHRNYTSTTLELHMDDGCHRISNLDGLVELQNAIRGAR